jgi:hypothetical protein
MPYLTLPKAFFANPKNHTVAREEIIEGIHQAFRFYFLPQYKHPVLRPKICIPFPIAAPLHFMKIEEAVLLCKGRTRFEVILHHVASHKAIRLQLPFCWLEAQVESETSFFQFRPNYWINLNHLVSIVQFPHKSHALYFSNQHSMQITGAEKRRILGRFEFLGKQKNIFNPGIVMP